jgi:hypothetical protein
MLQAMGWSEGKGLGKNEDGMASHIKVSLKANNLGTLLFMLHSFLQYSFL